jgi:hypothetical protein
MRVLIRIYLFFLFTPLLFVLAAFILGFILGCDQGCPSREHEELIATLAGVHWVAVFVLGFGTPILLLCGFVSSIINIFRKYFDF